MICGLQSGEGSGWMLGAVSLEGCWHGCPGRGGVTVTGGAPELWRCGTWGRRGGSGLDWSIREVCSHLVTLWGPGPLHSCIPACFSAPGVWHWLWTGSFFQPPPPSALPCVQGCRADPTPQQRPGAAGPWRSFKALQPVMALL